MADSKGYMYVPKYEPLVMPESGKREETKGEQQLMYAVKGRPAFAFVDLFLKPGQNVIADAGAMLWMDGGVPIETGCFGGCCASCMRTLAGESCCFNKFSHPGRESAGDSPVRVSFGFDLPGDMLPFGVQENKGWVLTRKAFVVGTENVVVSARFAGCMACCFSGEGPFLTKVTVSRGEGMFFAGSYGALERHEIDVGKVFFVDTGLFFAAKQDVKIGIGLAGGIKTCCCGGEGFVMKFNGPAVIYTKSRDPSIFDEGPNAGHEGGEKDPASAGANAAAGAAVRS
jgi:uncharacterized protein (TIGR00266 family)